MPESRDGLLKHYQRTRADFLAAIDGLSDDELSEPSLDGWSVKDHLLHIAYWDEIRASEVSRVSAGFDSAWRLTGEQDEALNKIVYPARRDLSPAQARWEFRQRGPACLKRSRPRLSVGWTRRATGRQGC